jgi:hypothetical protein
MVGLSCCDQLEVVLNEEEDSWIRRVYIKNMYKYVALVTKLFWAIGYPFDLKRQDLLHVMLSLLF